MDGTAKFAPTPIRILGEVRESDSPQIAGHAAEPFCQRVHVAERSLEGLSAGGGCEQRDCANQTASSGKHHEESGFAV
jgi:hypothetical protein